MRQWRSRIPNKIRCLVFTDSKNLTNLQIFEPIIRQISLPKQKSQMNLLKLSKLPTKSPTKETSHKTKYVQRTFKPTYRPEGTSHPTTDDLTSIINKEMSVPPSYSTQSTTSNSPSRCDTSVLKSLQNKDRSVFGYY